MNKIDTQDLRIGMYVCELDRPWRETPFLFQGFEIRTEDELKTLRQYCRTVYIKTLESHAPSRNAPDSRPVPPKPPLSADPTKLRASLLYQDMLKINNHPGGRSVYADETTLEEEVSLVKETFAEASAMVQEIMWQAKFGKSLDVPGARKVVGKMMESVLRNPDALTCFTQLKKKDEYTAQHSLRSSILALVFGRQLGLSQEELELLGLGALLCDIGKMKIPSEILNRPAPLAPDEIGVIRMHVPWGVEILEKTNQIPYAAIEIARRHHERFDGSGYLEKLSGDAIGQLGMIAGIVDHYDAVTSDRPFRAGVTAHTALKKMYEWRGTLFQPDLVEKFIQCMGIYPIGSIVELNTGEIGVVAALNRMQRLKPRVALALRADKTPYPEMPVVNLVGRTTPQGRPCEIERVLEPDVCDIDPTPYLPLPTAI